MLKKIIALILATLSLFTFTSCGGPKYAHCELVLNLPDSFSERESDDYDAVFSDGEVFVGILRVSFAAGVTDGIPETMTATEFGELWNDRCSRFADVKNKGGVTFSEYYDYYGGVDGYYFEAFYRSEHAYFVVLFATQKSLEEIKYNEIFNYATGVSFREWRKK